MTANRRIDVQMLGEAILAGRQPRTLTLQHLRRGRL